MLIVFVVTIVWLSVLAGATLIIRGSRALLLTRKASCLWAVGTGAAAVTFASLLGRFAQAYLVMPGEWVGVFL
jgi:hypothetical protein